MTLDDSNIKRLLVSIAIEKSLIEVNPSLYTKVVNMLHDKYNVGISDTYDHPEYLRDVLKEIYGNAGNVIIDSIKEKLDEFSSYPQVSKFLQIITT